MSYRSGREELDRLCRGHRRNVPCREPEHPDPRDELPFESASPSSLETMRQFVTSPDGCDRHLEHDLALKGRVCRATPTVDRVDRRLVAVEHELDLLARPCRPAALAGALGLSAGAHPRWRRPWRGDALEPRGPAAEPAAGLSDRDAATALSARAVSRARSTRVFSPRTALSALASVLVSTSRSRSSASWSTAPAARLPQPSCGVRHRFGRGNGGRHVHGTLHLLQRLLLRRRPNLDFRLRLRLGCSSRNSTMRSGTAGVSASGRGRSGSSGITMPSPMNIRVRADHTPETALLDSDGVQGVRRRGNWRWSWRSCCCARSGPDLRQQCLLALHDRKRDLAVVRRRAARHDPAQHGVRSDFSAITVTSRCEPGSPSTLSAWRPSAARSGSITGSPPPAICVIGTTASPSTYSMSRVTVTTVASCGLRSEIDCGMEMLRVFAGSPCRQHGRAGRRP